MSDVNLRPFVRRGLDVLFIALNAPVQSNANTHWFSGTNSRMYELMYRGGLLTKHVPKDRGDEIVFGSTAANHEGAEYGVVDLVDDVVETHSSRVRPTRDHVARLIGRMRDVEPRFVCVIHSKVRDALNRHARLSPSLNHGMCGPLLSGCRSGFVLNYFPNGNAVQDADKIEIFEALRNAL